ncbi:DNA gyrase inhibitor YacG [Rhodovibrio salinarum]|uniref:DNA gyrase inhibitor YacG n=1 Tax=Rhodovibrio salinarum TaxID=1087 RepID=A0A934QFL3_9PROT|nr:DNA gyrase inhibitor YacG [Rhodovibrio salinarum]MBK1696106.1 DNA gyrase inhibitor YacG [Rhodovibrio salinarum]
MTDKKHQDRVGTTGTARGASCPMCGKAAAERHHPFCSKRCQHLDLARWLDGSYRVPTDEPADLSDLPREDEE